MNSPRPSAARAIRGHCLECLNATDTGGAHDCLSSLCPLYSANPFRGRLLPKTHRPLVYDEVAEEARIARHHAKFARRIAGSATIKRMCRECACDSPEDCGKVTCALYQFRAALRKWRASLPADKFDAQKARLVEFQFAPKSPGTGNPPDGALDSAGARQEGQL